MPVLELAPAAIETAVEQLRLSPEHIMCGKGSALRFCLVCAFQHIQRPLILIIVIITLSLSFVDPLAYRLDITSYAHLKVLLTTPMGEGEIIRGSQDVGSYVYGDNSTIRGFFMRITDVTVAERKPVFVRIVGTHSLNGIPQTLSFSLQSSLSKLALTSATLTIPNELQGEVWEAILRSDTLEGFWVSNGKITRFSPSIGRNRSQTSKFCTIDGYGSFINNLRDADLQDAHKMEMLVDVNDETDTVTEMAFGLPPATNRV